LSRRVFGAGVSTLIDVTDIHSRSDVQSTFRAEPRGAATA
jgi:hypothetical protein